LSILIAVWLAFNVVFPLVLLRRRRWRPSRRALAYPRQFAHVRVDAPRVR
jgi:hypothetical protein